MINYEDYLAQDDRINETQCVYDDYCDVHHDSHNDSYWVVPVVEPNIDIGNS